MRKTYKCSNIKFCMEDENQRRTWNYLQSLTRKDGSYGKILSDALVAVMEMGDTDREHEQTQSGYVHDECGLKQNDDIYLRRAIEETVKTAVEQAVKQTMEEQSERICEAVVSLLNDRDGVTGEDASDASCGSDREQAGTEEEQMQQPEISADMMAFAFAVGE